MSIAGLIKPEYLFRPRQLIRRVRYKPIAGQGWIRLEVPWGDVLSVDAEQLHARLLAKLGVMDLAVTEILFRLMPAGGLAVDVGANIGYMSSAMSAAAGPEGKVIAFEANPAVARTLKENAVGFAGATVRVEQAAVSDAAGSVMLHFPAGATNNDGLVSVRPADGSDDQLVEAVKLDDALPPGAIVEMLKVDVEGHEEQVFRGAKRLLSERRVRRIIFEEHRKPPTPVTERLEGAGFRLFRVGRRFRGPTLTPLHDAGIERRWEPANFLATLTPDDDVVAVSRPGWQSLRSRG